MDRGIVYRDPNHFPLTIENVDEATFFVRIDERIRSIGAGLFGWLCNYIEPIHFVKIALLKGNLHNKVHLF